MSKAEQFEENDTVMKIQCNNIEILIHLPTSLIQEDFKTTLPRKRVEISPEKGLEIWLSDETFIFYV